MTLLCNRKGPTLFPDAQQGVQTLSQMPFLLSHLAQIKTIYPEAYALEARKTHPKEKLLHPSFHERLVAFKAEGNIASSSTFEVPLSPLPEVPTAASLAQAKSAKSSHNATMEREEPAPASATGQDDIETNIKAGATKARFPSNTKEGRAERYAAVLRRVKEREAKLAAAGSAEEQKEAFLFKSLPQLNLVLRSLFVVKKFKPIPLDEALVQLCSSYRDAFGLSVERQDVERRLKMLKELMPDMLQTKEGMDRKVFLVLPRGAIPGDRLQAAIDAKQQPQDQKMAIDATVSKA
ncbi:uncharacterized protein ACA1_253510 [Acanthamoeba castellanii str. Neff]|uniref:CDT1 Geminin-binding domain-containing protein n=1 Tax=Acanthamoeba castellanii (strain ATCC 30010 / Neff) TaxID=1257118 RepID=L8HA06_ACACF|nr:uncharacterized protein ACA1_253510 [Acanthamoeba castellanii str. Neff]ELR22364.1 hypothetical protein ACA1_253510 [Acanthamoeba castellanii str. Neff]